MMKIFVLFLLIGISVAQQEQPIPDARCNQVHPDNHVIVFPHPDCTRFYKCVGGLACELKLINS